MPISTALQEMLKQNRGLFFWLAYLAVTSALSSLTGFSLTRVADCNGCAGLALTASFAAFGLVMFGGLLHALLLSFSDREIAEKGNAVTDDRSKEDVIAWTTIGALWGACWVFFAVFDWGEWRTVGGIIALIATVISIPLGAATRK